MDVLLRGDVLEGLKRELGGVVKCPHFGACIDRGVFEGVVESVMGGLGLLGDDEGV